MLTRDQIRNLTKKFQTTEVNVRREYVQHLFLSYFYQTKEASKIFFKGGTALRFRFNSPRFSEDLDFSTTYSGIKTIEKPVQDALVAIEREGVLVNIIESKKTSGGYLGKIEFNIKPEKVTLQLNISQRESGIHGEIMTIVNDFIPAYTIMGLNLEDLVEEKFNALIFRKKPRDFYDLYFLLRANVVPVKIKGRLTRLLTFLNEININYEKELKIFLPKSHWMVIKDFKKNIIREIERFRL